MRSTKNENVQRCHCRVSSRLSFCTVVSEHVKNILQAGFLKNMILATVSEEDFRREEFPVKCSVYYICPLFSSFLISVLEQVVSQFIAYISTFGEHCGIIVRFQCCVIESAGWGYCYALSPQQKQEGWAKVGHKWTDLQLTTRSRAENGEEEGVGGCSTQNMLQEAPPSRSLPRNLLQESCFSGNPPHRKSSHITWEGGDEIERARGNGMQAPQEPLSQRVWSLSGLYTGLSKKRTKFQLKVYDRSQIYRGTIGYAEQL